MSLREFMMARGAPVAPRARVEMTWHLFTPGALDTGCIVCGKGAGDAGTMHALRPRDIPHDRPGDN